MTQGKDEAAQRASTPAAPGQAPADETECWADAGDTGVGVVGVGGVGGVAGAAVSRRVLAQMEQVLARRPPAGLHLVATPIGNLSDITFRAINTLAQADVIYAEDTRHSARLLTHYGITRPVRAYHDHSGDATRDEIVAAVTAGRVVALISDAGTPLISDPGVKLVRAVIAAGGAVFSVPGASAVLTALTSSGLATDQFLFAGFLPPKSQQRRKRLSGLIQAHATIVLYEAPQRLPAMLGEIAQLDGTREITVARELTKQFEEVVRGTAEEVFAALSNRTIKGECVVVIAPPQKSKVVDDAEIAARLDELPGDTSVRDAARIVALDLDLPKGRVYQIAIERAKAK